MEMISFRKIGIYRRGSCVLVICNEALWCKLFRLIISHATAAKGREIRKHDSPRRYESAIIDVVFSGGMWHSKTANWGPSVNLLNDGAQVR